MLHTHEQRLIIITEPVGAGKSTISRALAQSLRRPAVTVAVIDLDQVYGFVQQQDGYGDVPAWASARYGAAALANCWFTTGLSVVIVEGEFFTAAERDTLTAVIHTSVRHAFFTLHLSYEQALERVQHDPTRGASKNPAFLQARHEDFAQALPFLCQESVVIATDGLTQREVVAHLLAAWAQA